MTMRTLALSAVTVLLACSDPAATPPDGPAPEARPIFLNRGGGAYVSGPDDASTNTAAVLDEAHDFAAFELDDRRWNAVRDCVAERFAPFNVQITDVDPGATQHLEAVFLTASDWATLPFGPNVLGITAGGCNAEPRPIALISAAAFGAEDVQLCEIAAQVLASSQGLDKVLHCPDVMSLEVGCGDKRFVDELHDCGDFSARPCACGGTRQNSFAKLEAAFGLAD